MSEPAPRYGHEPGPEYEVPPRTKCLLAALDGLEQTKIAFQTWAKTCNSVIERHAANVMVKSTEELIITVRNIVREQM